MLWFLYLPERVLYYPPDQLSRGKRDKVVALLDRWALKDERGFLIGLDFDSLDLVELVMAFEDELGIAVSGDKAVGVRSFAGLIDYLIRNSPD
jgi:acyl carrier protein